MHKGAACPVPITAVNFMQKKETAIEVKVGALVLFATLLLGGFFFLLGDVRVGDDHELFVQFETAGGLKTGADVALSGIVVGSVRNLEFITNEDPDAGLPAVAVQATVRVNPTYADSIRKNSRFYITTRGVLGEPYIEISTLDFSADPVPRGATIRGVDPPRMEILLGQAEELLETLADIVSEDEEDVRALISNASFFFETVGDAVGENRDDIDQTMANLQTSTRVAAQLLGAVNASIGDDGQKLQAIVNDLEATSRNTRNLTGRLGGQIDPLIADVAELTADAREITGTTRRLLVDNEGRILATLDNVETSTENLRIITEDAQAMVEGVSEGEGTLGALMTDREMYEDLKDILRTIKQQPWRILWKE